MQPDLPLKSAQPRRKWIPYFVSVIALVLTAEATIYVAITAKAKDKLRFENAVGRSQDDIQQRLNTYITLLRGGSGLFAANDSVSSSQFAAFVNRLNLRQQYPGVQGIGFSVRVTPQEKDALVAQMKRQGVEILAFDRILSAASITQLFTSNPRIDVTKRRSVSICSQSPPVGKRWNARVTLAHPQLQVKSH